MEQPMTPNPILEAATTAVDNCDALGCGCCASGGRDQHDDGTPCYAGEPGAPCGGKWLGPAAGYSCGGRYWERAEVIAYEAVAAARPLIEAEVWRQSLVESAEASAKINTHPAHVWVLAAWDYGTRVRMRAGWKGPRLEGRAQ